MSKESKEKPILSVRIDQGLLVKVDRLVERTGVGRAEIIERCLAVGLQDEEEFVQWLEHPLKGPVVQMLSHPKVLPLLLRLLGDKDGPDETQMKVRENIRAKRSKKPTPKTAQG